jgi:hypothetical protein
MEQIHMSGHAGSCHCGAVKFLVDAEIQELTTCDCSLCVKKNALMTKVHESQLSITEGEAFLTLYQWNTQRAKHYFCSRCGIYTFHRKRAAPDHFGVNVRCLDDFDPKTVPVRVTAGACMSVVSAAPRDEWPGPREPLV